MRVVVYHVSGDVTVALNCWRPIGCAKQEGKKNSDVIGCESLAVFIILGLYKTPFYKSKRILPQLSCSPQTYFLDSVIITTELCSFTKHSRLGTAVKVDNTLPGTHRPYLGITIKELLLTIRSIATIARSGIESEV